MDSSKPRQLHIYFLPHMAPGHLIPLVDMARQFARSGAKATIVTTPLNATLFSNTIERDTQLGFEISIRQVNFPSAEAGLPYGCENMASITSTEMMMNFFKALDLLQQPLELLLGEDHPDCLVASILFPWATEVAEKFGIPRLVFNGAGSFPLCVHHSLTRHEPHKKVESDSDAFVVPDLPDKIKMTRAQLPDNFREGAQSHWTSMIEKAMEAEKASYGVVVNSFRELEPAYSDYYRNVIGRRVWQVGPVSLCNRDDNDKAQRGDESAIAEQDVLSWLNSKRPNSVIYVCFGSMPLFSDAQLLEIAMGLEGSGQQFIWVVRKQKGSCEEKEEWFPEGFEKRMDGKGLIIRGWAPQVLILDHEAVGGFMTHCGWNSLLEGVTAGVPMVTWPLFAEQLYNEKLVVDVLRIGVPVGVQQWCRRTDEQVVSVKREDIEKAVSQLMVGTEVEEMRGRAEALKDMAKNATEEGGSSHTDLNSLLQELRSNFPCTTQNIHKKTHLS